MILVLVLALAAAAAALLLLVFAFVFDLVSVPFEVVMLGLIAAAHSLEALQYGMNQRTRWQRLVPLEIKGEGAHPHWLLK